MIPFNYRIIYLKDKYFCICHSKIKYFFSIYTRFTCFFSHVTLVKHFFEPNSLAIVHIVCCYAELLQTLFVSQYMLPINSSPPNKSHNFIINFFCANHVLSVHYQSVETPLVFLYFDKFYRILIGIEVYMP